MRIRILDEGDEHALSDLRSWLSRDPGTAMLSVEPVTGDGPTMGALEALDIILSNGTNVANFALAYATWRATRANEAVGGTGEGDGGRTLIHEDSTVTIGHLSPQELADLLRRLNGGDPDEGTSA